MANIPASNRNWQVIDPAHLGESIANLEAVLRGETVDGVKIGSAGITRKWCLQSLASLQAIQAGSATGDVCDQCGGNAVPGTRRCEGCEAITLENAFGSIRG